MAHDEVLLLGGDVDENRSEVALFHLIHAAEVRSIESRNVDHLNWELAQGIRQCASPLENRRTSTL